jgi:hypothetical protein
MRKMLHDQEKEDVAKRAAKVAAGKRYQEELDQQLNELRTRSFNSLASKFSPFFLCWVLYSVALLFDACILFCADNLNARCVESSNDVIPLSVGRKLIAVKPSTCVCCACTETMSEQEQLYNADLLRKTAVHL